MKKAQDILNKLTQLDPDFQNPEMLVDFIVAMLENQKDKNQVFVELLELIPEQARELSEFLFSIEERPSRLYQSAFSAITSSKVGQKGEQKVDLRSKISSGKDLRSLLSKKKDTRAERERIVKQVHKIIPNITIVTNVPKPVIQPIKTQCRFGALCSNESCKFDHHVPACKYYPNCTNQFCTFSHPNRKSVHSVFDSEMEIEREVMDCKFDPNCLRIGCHFNHPSIKS